MNMEIINSNQKLITTTSTNVWNIIRVRRVTQTNDGTFGVLLNNFTPIAITLEQPWKNNERNISCIPTGQYLCKRIVSFKFGDTYEVQAVDNRSNILFHKGNIVDDTSGCILVAEKFETLNYKTAILQSKKGFNDFMNAVDGAATFKLIVEEANGWNY